MTKESETKQPAVLKGSFGFNPNESAAHFLIHIPRSSQQPVDISEHLSWNPHRLTVAAHFNVEREDGQMRVQLPRAKWNEVADALRASFNARLKKMGRPPGRWKSGFNTVVRSLGKELTLLCWAIEDADPALIPNALANWGGLAPEERWWLYTMTAASAGNAINDRGKGWRKAVRFALAETHSPHRLREEKTVPEYFRLASEPSLFGSASLSNNVDTDDDEESE